MGSWWMVTYSRAGAAGSRGARGTQRASTVGDAEETGVVDSVRPVPLGVEALHMLTVAMHM